MKFDDTGGERRDTIQLVLIAVIGALAFAALVLAGLAWMGMLR